MFGKKKQGIRGVLSILIITGIMIIILSAAAFMTEKGSLSEDMMFPIVCMTLFIAAFTGSLLLNKNSSYGKMIRGFIIGLVMFGVPYIIGKTASIEPLETGKAVALLAFSVTGSICGAVITNKKRRYKRR